MKKEEKELLVLVGIGVICWGVYSMIKKNLHMIPVSNKTTKENAPISDNKEASTSIKEFVERRRNWAAAKRASKEESKKGPCLLLEQRDDAITAIN